MAMLDSMLFNSPITRLLRARPDLCYLANLLTPQIEEYGALALLGPPRLRLAAMALLTGMQIGFASTLRLWLFPVTSTVMLVPLLPAVVWDSSATPSWRTVLGAVTGNRASHRDESCTD